jgi:cell division protein FtsL
MLMLAAQNDFSFYGILTRGYEFMHWSTFQQNLLVGLATILVAIAGFMASTIFQLNEKMAIIVTKVERHETELRDVRTEIKEVRRQNECFDQPTFRK